MEVLSPLRPSERGDIVRPLRLQGFSDAVFATAATFLVIPIRRFKLKDKEETLKDALIRQYPELIVFVIGFLIICTLWESHNLRFKVIAKIDDFIVFLTFISLMCTTFLPFTVALAGHYEKEAASIVLPCMILLFVEILDLVMFFYAFRTPRLLSPQLRDLGRNELRVKEFQIIAKVSVNCVLFIAAAGFSPLSVVVSWIFLCSVILTPLFKKAIVHVSRICCCPGDERRSDVLTGKISKERIEVFSDAAVAIIATLLVLDITTEEFPKKSEVEEKGLNKTLQDMWPQFVAYMGAYVTVGILWFVHHSVLHQIKSLTPIMTVCNNIFLAFLAGSPFVSTLVNKFTGKSSHNEKIAVRVSCVIVFMAGFMQIVIFVLAFLQRGKLMYSWAIPDGARGQRTHLYVLLKTLIVPTMTFITFCSSLTTDFVTFVVYHVALFMVPLLFLILKIACAWHCNQLPLEEDPSSAQHSQEDEQSVQEMPIIIDNIPVEENEEGAVPMSPQHLSEEHDKDDNQDKVGIK